MSDGDTENKYIPVCIYIKPDRVSDLCLLDREINVLEYGILELGDWQCYKTLRIVLWFNVHLGHTGHKRWETEAGTDEYGYNIRL